MTENDDLSPEEVIELAMDAVAQADEVLQDYPTPTQLTGKVVGFLNSREVIMDLGRADGVKVGMQFAILVPRGVPVFDDDGKEIGRVAVAKAVVKVVRVDGDHISIGRTFMTIKGRPARDLRSAAAGSMISFLYQEAIPDRVESFDVPRSETIRAGTDMKVRKGDEVQLTTGDEFIFPG